MTSARCCWSSSHWVCSRNFGSDLRCTHVSSQSSRRGLKMVIGRSARRCVRVVCQSPMMDPARNTERPTMVPMRSGAMYTLAPACDVLTWVLDMLGGEISLSVRGCCAAGGSKDTVTQVNDKTLCRHPETHWGMVSMAV